MGASGNLSIIDLEKYSFIQIKEKFLSEILNYCPNYSDNKNENEIFYFKVSETHNINDFINLFRSKIVDYCPEEKGLYINSVFYNNWAEKDVPIVVDNNLILYETDQQMSYQNLPFYMLQEISYNEIEIWT
jgi:hypothetical protein